MRAGQVMVLTVLALGGTILGATTIAGLLMLYQIRQTTDMANSARAIFAADAGIEKSLYDMFCNKDLGNCPAPNPGRFGNGATVNAVCYDGTGAAVTCSDPNVTVKRIRSVGQAGDAARAFETTF